MTSFDIDDPLGDLLSDGSNDSFFEDPKARAKRSSLTKIPDKKSITDLFGLDEPKPKDKPPNPENDWLGLGEDRPKTAERPKSALVDKAAFAPKPTKKISFEDDDSDVLNTLGFDRKPEAGRDASLGVVVKQSKKSALMESIFGPPKQQPEQPSSFEDILKQSKVGRAKVEPPIQAAPQGTVEYGPTEGRRSRLQRTGSGVLDPLGLFTDDSAVKAKEPEEWTLRKAKSAQGAGDAGVVETEVLLAPKPRDMSTKSASNIKDLPDWLGGSLAVGVEVKSKSDVGIGKSEQDGGKTVSYKEKEIDLNVHTSDITQPNMEVITDNPKPLLESLITQQKLATSHIEYQNTSIALQQQESQLLVALQMRKYEENMAEMQRQQQDVLMKQEQQFNSLLERQFAKQQIMENNMRLQQERINSHIQMLISQPPVSGHLHKDDGEVELLKKNSADENSRLYEEMIVTLKQRQHEEIFLLNESYKKQISLLENSMESVENRLKTELTNLSEQFHNTIEKNNKDHDVEVEKYKQKLQETSLLHENEIKMLRDNNNRMTEEIKYEYSAMVENMKQLRQTENLALGNANTYKEKLDSNLEILDVNSKILNEIQDKVRRDYSVLSVAREEATRAKEEEIKLMRITLEKSREATDSERAQLMGLVRSLETKLVEQSQNAKEERWALQQAAAVLAARSAAFDREITFTRSSLDREQDQLKTLKESLLAEQENVMLRLTEEKLQLAAEKSRTDTSAKLNQSYDSQRARAEVDAAVRVAKEAAELTDREREALHRQQSDVEMLKRHLVDKDRKLDLKQKELEEMFRNAQRKAEDGETALADAKVLEAKYNARLRDIQGQLVSLMGREKKLTEDKIALSKERLALHNNLRQVKKCGLCATDNLKPEDGNYTDDVVEQDFSPLLFVATDPDILRLRYEISEERLLVEKDIDEGDSKKTE